MTNSSFFVRIQNLFVILPIFREFFSQSLCNAGIVHNFLGQKSIVPSAIHFYFAQFNHVATLFFEDQNLHTIRLIYEFVITRLQIAVVLIPVAATQRAVISESERTVAHSGTLKLTVYIPLRNQSESSRANELDTMLTSK